MFKRRHNVGLPKLASIIVQDNFDTTPRLVSEPRPTVAPSPSSSSPTLTPKSVSDSKTKVSVHLTDYANYSNSNEPFKYDIIDMSKNIEQFCACKTCGGDLKVNIVSRNGLAF